MIKPDTGTGCRGEGGQGGISSAPQVCTLASGTQSCTDISTSKEIFIYSVGSQAGASPIRLFKLLEIQSVLKILLRVTSESRFLQDERQLFMHFF